MTAQTTLLVACFTVVLAYLIYWFRIASNLEFPVCNYLKSAKFILANAKFTNPAALIFSLFRGIYSLPIV